MIPLSDFRPQGVVFDLDGTLTDNMACHAEAFGLFLTHHGLPGMTMAMRHRIDGKRNSEIFPILFERELTARGDSRVLGREGERLSRAVAGTAAAARRGRHAARATGRARHRRGRRDVGAGEERRAHAFGHRPGGSHRRHHAERRGAARQAVSRCVPASGARARRGARGVSGVRGCAGRRRRARSAGMRCVAITSTFSAETLAASDPPPDAAYRDFDAYLEGDGRWLLN